MKTHRRWNLRSRSRRACRGRVALGLALPRHRHGLDRRDDGLTDLVDLFETRDGVDRDLSGARGHDPSVSRAAISRYHGVRTLVAR